MPSVPWRVEFSKIFKKIFSKFQKCPKVFPKVSKRVLNMFWGKLFEKSFAQCSMEGRVFENFLTNQKILKLQKCPKPFPKVSKHSLNMFWGKLFEKFLPSFRWNVESSKIFKKIKKFAKFQKCPKSFAKVSKRVLNLFWVKFFEKNFLPSDPWRVEFSKIFKFFFFKIAKMPKSVLKSIQTCFEHVVGQTFRKNFAQFSMECRVFENFQKKYFQNSKNAQKCSQKYPNVFYRDFFEKKFMPGVPWRVDFSKIFKKKYFQNS